MKSLDPISRILISALFILSGVSKIMNWSGTADYMAAQGMVLIPLLLGGAILVELVGGLSILFGVGARIGAAALFAFLIPTTLIFHDFWTLTGPDRALQMVQFLKNLAIMGGLLYIVRHGAGTLSIDESAYHRHRENQLQNNERVARIRRVS